MLELLKNIQYRWLLHSVRSIRRQQPASWDAIRRVAIVVNNRSNLNKNEMDVFLHKTGKYVEVFFVETNNRSATFSDWHCFTKEHMNVLGLPKSSVLKDLRVQNFDLLINTADSTDSFASLVATALPAALKCTAGEDLKHADLMISARNTYGLVDYLGHVLRYLQMIRV